MDNNARKTETILVLGLALDPGSVPKPELERRLEAALEQWRTLDGCPRIVVSGGILPGQSRSECAVMAEWLSERGVPSELIRREETSRNTMENLVNVHRMLEQGSGVLIITSDYHVLRVRCSAARRGLKWKVMGIRVPFGREKLVCCLKEVCFLIDLALGWQDEGRTRPEIVRVLFNRVFGENR